MAKIALVSCVSSKLAHSAPAKDLYTSPLFVKSRRYAQENAERWYILSAEHYLLKPETIVEPYEKTLNKMPKAERAQWAEVVFHQLECLTAPSDEIIFLAGERYREDLEGLLSKRGNLIVVPMRGLPIGKQLQWLTRHTDEQSLSILDEFYRLVAKLEEVLTGGRILSD